MNEKKKSRKLTEPSRRNWSGIQWVRLKEDLSTQDFGEPQVSKIYSARNGLINSLA